METKLESRLAPVKVHRYPGHPEPFIALATQFQTRFRFSLSADLSAPRVIFSNRFAPRLVWVNPEHGVVVAIRNCFNICRYLQLPTEAYFLVCSLVGLIQWRALTLNPLLTSDDLVSRDRPYCLLMHPATVNDIAILLEHPRITPESAEFFRCVGAELEVEALQQTLDHMRAFRLSVSSN